MNDYMCDSEKVADKQKRSIFLFIYCNMVHYELVNNKLDICCHCNT